MLADQPGSQQALSFLRPTPGSPFSAFTPISLTCKATGLAQVHSAGQSQQGQPQGPGYHPVVEQTGLGTATAVV